MEEICDQLEEFKVASLLTTNCIGRPLRITEELESTSLEAWKLAGQGAPHGLTVVADRQTGGRGRKGRGWFSPGGMNLYFSVILRPTFPPAQAAQTTLVAAVAICEAIRESSGVKATIKWPNDVEIAGRKVAGILTELSAVQEKTNFLILGIGVDVNMTVADFPEEIRDTATSLQIATSRCFSRSHLLAALLVKLENYLEACQQQGFSAVRRRWKELSSMLGVGVRAELNGKYIEGTAEDLDDQGRLLVKTSCGQYERIVAGDVQRLRTQ